MCNNVASMSAAVSKNCQSFKCKIYGIPKYKFGGDLIMLCCDLAYITLTIHALLEERNV